MKLAFQNLHFCFVPNVKAAYNFFILFYLTRFKYFVILDIHMRMWMVDPTGMCQKHLLGEHVETHMFLGSLNKKLNLAGYIRKGLFEFKSLQQRHDALAAEISRRGYQHKSPLGEVPVAVLSEVANSFVDRAIALQELVQRCPECAAKLNKK